MPPPLEDFKPTGTGEPPLAKAEGLGSLFGQRRRARRTRCRNGRARAGITCASATRRTANASSGRAERYWMGGERVRTNRAFRNAADAATPGGVDLYVGGTEHAVLHLLYARFWHKVLFDLGHVSTPEPFQRLVNQGMILGEDGHKMSKRRGNVVDPGRRDRRIRRGRVPLLRNVHGPARADEAMEHERRRRRLALPRPRLAADDGGEPGGRMGSVRRGAGSPSRRSAQQKVMHATIKKVGDDIEALAFNTAISQMMIFVNAFTNGGQPGPSPRCARCSCC